MFAFHRIFITIYPNSRRTLYMDSKCSLPSRNLAMCLTSFSQLIQNDQLHNRLSFLRKKRLRHCIRLKKHVRESHEDTDEDSLKPCFKYDDSKTVQVPHASSVITHKAGNLTWLAGVTERINSTFHHRLYQVKTLTSKFTMPLFCTA